MTLEEQAAADAKTLKDEKDKKDAQDLAEAKAWSLDPLVVEGDAKNGGAFSITGEGFGTQGSLTIAGEVIKTTRWTDRSIKGTLPAGLSGDVVLKTAKGTRRGKWPYVRSTVKTFETK